MEAGLSLGASFYPVADYAVPGDRNLPLGQAAPPPQRGRSPHQDAIRDAARGPRLLAGWYPLVHESRENSPSWFPPLTRPNGAGRIPPLPAPCPPGHPRRKRLIRPLTSPPATRTDKGAPKCLGVVSCRNNDGQPRGFQRIQHRNCESGRQVIHVQETAHSGDRHWQAPVGHLLSLDTGHAQTDSVILLDPP